MRIQTYLREERPDGSCNIEGYIQNITDIQHRRNDINTLTHALNNAKESIFAARPDGTIIFANRRFLYNHGISENGFTGREALQVLSDYMVREGIEKLKAATQIIGMRERKKGYLLPVCCIRFLP